MEALKAARMGSTNIKEKTWKQYSRVIQSLARGFTGQDYKNNDFLITARKQVVEYINKKSKSDAQKRMYYSVILIMLAPDKKDTDAQEEADYEFYQDKLQQLAQRYNEQKSQQLKTVKQDKNWVSWDDILKLQNTMALEVKGMIKKDELIQKTLKFVNKKGAKIYEKKGKQINRKQRTAIQNLLILSLYTLIKPRRLDYANMEIISRKNYNSLSSEDKQKMNYLVVVGRTKKFFSFGKQAQKNQNRDKHGVKQPVYLLDVPPKLNSIINIYMYFHPQDAFKDNFLTRTFLYNTRGGAISGDGLSKAMIKIMKARFKKNISPTMLRTIYLSDKHKNDVPLAEKQTTAEEMGHTVATANSSYQKQ